MKPDGRHIIGVAIIACGLPGGNVEEAKRWVARGGDARFVGCDFELVDLRLRVL